MRYAQCSGIPESRVIILKYYLKFKKINQLLLVVLSIFFAVFSLVKGSSDVVIDVIKDTWVSNIILQSSFFNSTLANIAAGYLVSWIFWLIVVYIPGRRRQIIAKQYFNVAYSDFRKDSIRTLLCAADLYKSEEYVDWLCDYKNFREYFNYDRKNRWYKALNGLEQNDSLLEELSVEIDLLRNELYYLVTKIPISDNDTLTGLKNSISYMYRLNNSPVFINEKVKHYGSFLWSLLAQWSVIDGLLDHDPISRLIKKI